MFQTIQLQGQWWAVFLVNPQDAKDRYMLTSTFDKVSEANFFLNEFRRIAGITERG